MSFQCFISICCPAFQIGHELDQLERQMLDAEVLAAAGPSSNLDESGMFSVQVLAKALQVCRASSSSTRCMLTWTLLNMFELDMCAVW